MAKNEMIFIRDVVHRLQLYLLEGIKDENQLFAAGSVMSRRDYQDVVIERSITKICGYPLCRNLLPSDQNPKGRYRISLKEHKVYDLQETYMYCSANCVVNSQAFFGSLQEEMLTVLNPAKLNELLGLFSELSLDSKEDVPKSGDLGLSELKIQEKPDTKDDEVSLEEWIRRSNAIEGYVPQRDRKVRSSRSKIHKGSRANNPVIDEGKEMLFNEMDFTSVIITQYENDISKSLSDSTNNGSSTKSNEPKGKVSCKRMDYSFTILDEGLDFEQSDPKRKNKEMNEEENKKVTSDKLGVSEMLASPNKNNLNVNVYEAVKEFDTEKETGLNAMILKSSLKSSSTKKESRSVTWADEETCSAGSRNLCDFRELDSNKEARKMSGFDSTELHSDSVHFEFAEACAIALTQAKEAVISGKSDVPDAVLEAGIITLPPPQDVNEAGSEENDDVLYPGPSPSKWPKKTGFSHSNFFDSEDSWYDSPPEGFSLTLSPFATMFMALFTWTCSTSLAYIYGFDESFLEDYLCVNGREYPKKVVSTDGHSSEIRKTLAGCLTRALPGLVADFRLPIPLSTLEIGMSCLLDTMSFMYPLPPFRMKQWQVVALLFIDALSVCRVPALAPHITNRRMFLRKVLGGSHITAEEYEVMKDLLVPLGRIP